MQTVMCSKCFRWTAVQVASSVAFWFVCWECLGITMPIMKMCSPTARMGVGVPHPYGSSVTGAGSHSQGEW